MASLTHKVETQSAYNKDKRPCELLRRNALASISDLMILALFCKQTQIEVLWTAPRSRKALGISELRNLARFETVQAQSPKLRDN